MRNNIALRTVILHVLLHTSCCEPPHYTLIAAYLHRLRVQHVAKDANGASALSVASVFNVHVLPSKLIRGPRTTGQQSHQRSCPQSQNAGRRHRDILSWLLRPFVLANRSSTKHHSRNSKKRCNCGCSLSYPTDTLRMVQYDMQTAAASTRVFASSTSSVGSVWGPILRPFANATRRDMERTNDHWCWVSQNKVVTPQILHVCACVCVFFPS